MNGKDKLHQNTQDANKHDKKSDGRSRGRYSKERNERSDSRRDSISGENRSENIDEGCLVICGIAIVIFIAIAIIAKAISFFLQLVSTNTEDMPTGMGRESKLTGPLIPTPHFSTGTFPRIWFRQTYLILSCLNPLEISV